MQLKGSCHCGAVKFRLQSDSPVPFMHCHCSICRKTAGSGGYAINLGGDAKSMKVAGMRNVTRFHALWGQVIFGASVGFMSRKAASTDP